jgi:hypothetical protein
LSINLFSSSGQFIKYIFYFHIMTHSLVDNFSKLLKGSPILPFFKTILFTFLYAVTNTYKEVIRPPPGLLTAAFLSQSYCYNFRFSLELRFSLDLA